MGERLGILGGTFDPPHIGHFALAIDALEQLPLDRVILIPAARQPLKANAAMSSPAHRLAMTRLLAALDERLSVDSVEVDRAGLSFTIDTVRTLRSAGPDREFTLVMGEDTAATLPQWREPDALASLVRIAIAVRGAAPEALPAGFDAQWLRARRIDLSATELRERVRAGRSVRGFVPDAVAAYIAAHGLYRTTDPVTS